MNAEVAQFPSEQSEEGAFERQEDAFRDHVVDDPGARFPAEAGRYHLYVSLACPWAHRIILLRELLGLHDAIGMTVVDPIRNEEEGWAFREGRSHGPDPVNGFRLLAEAYRTTDPAFAGRVTVPVLWDTVEGRIVSNSDDDLMRMLDGPFRRFSNDRWRFCPPEHLAEIDRLNALVYEHVNNGVYRAGFASTQKAYEDAVMPLFDTLDLLETRLGRTRFLLGDSPVETDIRLFVTLIRFDAVYHGHFKCNLRRIADYPNLRRFVADLRSLDGVEGTIDFDHIKRHYYVTHDDINPTRITPVGPDGALTRLAAGGGTEA